MRNSIFTACFLLMVSMAIGQSQWTGTWNTNFGEVILIEKNNKITGTYRDLGNIIVDYKGGNEIRGRFYNNGNKGFFKWTKNGNSVNGDWGWNSNRNGGSWTGKRTANASQGVLKGSWILPDKTKIELVHNKHNQVAGLYGNNGYIWGTYNKSSKTLTGKYVRYANDTPTRFEAKYEGNKIRGRVFKGAGSASWVVTRPSNGSNALAAKFKLKITFNSFKCNGSDNLRKVEQGNVYVMPVMKVSGATIRPRNFKASPPYVKSKLETQKTLNHDLSIGRKDSYKVGVVQNVQNSAEFHIPYSLNLINQNTYFQNQFVFSEWPVIANAGAMIFAERFRINDTRTINLKEVLKFLTGVTNAGDYSNAGSGRKRLPNSSDTFWLETVGSKRYVRGYGDIIEPTKGKIRFGYHYTLELVD
ncbi:hypothetical protein ACJD0Z_01145 [Flavobacteriaceae bacterium M23B6Z8]